MNIIPSDKISERFARGVGLQFWVARPQFTVEREDPRKISQLRAVDCCLHFDLAA